MRLSRWLAPLTGVLFVVLVVAGFVVGGEPPDAGEPVDEIIEHYVDNDSSVMLGAVLGAFAAVALVFFAGYLRKVLRAAEGPGEWLPTVALVGAAILAVGGTIDSTISFALADAVDDLDPAAVQALQALWDGDFLPLAAGTVIFLLAAGISIVTSGALPRWLGWVAIAIAVIGLTPIGFFAFLASGVWVLIVSILLAVRASAGGPPEGETLEARAAPGNPGA